MKPGFVAGLVAWSFFLTVPFIGRQIYREHFKKQECAVEKKESALEQEVASFSEIKVDSRKGKKTYLFGKKAKLNYDNTLEIYAKIYPAFEGYEEAAYLSRMDLNKDGVISEYESDVVLNKLLGELTRLRGY
jgi:hypothetical protein